MSRIASRIIEIPPQVEINFTPKEIRVKGKVGSKTLLLPAELEISQQGNQLLTKSENTAIAGTYNSLITNLIEGVSKGHRRVLVLEGSSYEVELENPQRLKFSLARIQPNWIEVPAEIEVKVEQGKTITLEGVDKQIVGEIAAKIRSLKPPSIYHEKKGIYLEGEKIKLKKRKVVK